MEALSRSDQQEVETVDHRHYQGETVFPGLLLHDLEANHVTHGTREREESSVWDSDDDSRQNDDVTISTCDVTSSCAATTDSV